MTKTMLMVLGCAVLALTACSGKSTGDDSAGLQACEGADCDDVGDESDGGDGGSDVVCEDFFGCVEGCADTGCAGAFAATHLKDAFLASAQSLLACVEAAGCRLDDENCILGACPDEAERFFRQARSSTWLGARCPAQIPLMSTFLTIVTPSADGRPTKHARLTALPRLEWAFESADHNGRWLALPFEGSLPDLVSTLAERFPGVLGLDPRLATGLST